MTCSRCAVIVSDAWSDMREATSTPFETIVAGWSGRTVVAARGAACRTRVWFKLRSYAALAAAGGAGAGFGGAGGGMYLPGFAQSKQLSLY